MKEISINDRLISTHSKPFIVAEAGVNYYEIASVKQIDLIEAAKMMVQVAATAGAGAIKFQTYKAEKLACRSAPSYWDLRFEGATSQFELFKKYDEFGEQEYRELARYATSCKIAFLSTPFDAEAVDFLNDMVPAFKVASSDITNLPLIRQIADKHKPIFLSTGGSGIQEIAAAVDCIHREGNEQIVLMHCILNYPTEYSNANLGMIKHIKRAFPDYLTGYSDHTLPDPSMLVLITSVLFGATVLEKHFTLDRSIPGNDHYHAMDEVGLRTLVKNLQLLDLITRGAKKEPLRTEYLAIRNARRSIVAKRRIIKGTSINLDLITFKRPGTGISPKDVQQVVGQIAVRNIEEDEVIKWKDVTSP